MTTQHTPQVHAPEEGPLSRQELARRDAWWRMANYLLDNPLSREPPTPEHIKPRLLRHWGTTPGLGFVHDHLNRVIKFRAWNAMYVTGPGHGDPRLVSSSYLGGTYSEVYPEIGRDTEGIRRLFRQHRFPCGIPGHVVAFENPRLLVPGAIERVPGLAVSVAGLRQRMSDEGVRARARRRARGEGDTAVTAWTWPHARSGAAAGKDS